MSDAPAAALPPPSPPESPRFYFGFTLRDLLFIALITACYLTPLWPAVAEGWWSSANLMLSEWRLAAGALVIVALSTWLASRQWGFAGRVGGALFSALAAPLLVQSLLNAGLPIQIPEHLGPAPWWPWAVGGLLAVRFVSQWRWRVALAAVLFFGVTTAVAINQYLDTAVVHDLQFFDQFMWKTLHGQFLASTLEPPSALGIHFAPIELAWLPFYALAPSGITLLVLQSAAVAAAAFPLHRIIQRRGLPDWVAFALVVGWLCSPSVAGPVLDKFHEYPFAPLFFLWAWDCLERKRFGWFVACLLGLLMVKEQTGLVVLAFAVVALPGVMRKELGARWAAAPALLGVLGLITAQVVMARHLPPGAGAGTWRRNYGYLGDTPRQGLAFAAKHPTVLADYATRPRNRIYLYQLLQPFGYWLPWGSGAAVAAVPDLTAIMLSDNMQYPFRRLRWHYHILIVTALLIGFAKVLAGTRKRFRLSAGAVAFPAALFFIFSAAGVPAFQYELGGVRLTPEQKAARLRIVERVPRAASVAASGHLVLFFTRRNEIVRLGVKGSLDHRPDFFTREIDPLTDVAPPLSQQLEHFGYRIIARDGPFELWHREGVGSAP